MFRPLLDTYNYIHVTAVEFLGHTHQCYSCSSGRWFLPPDAVRMKIDTLKLSVVIETGRPHA